MNWRHIKINTSDLIEAKNPQPTFAEAALSLSPAWSFKQIHINIVIRIQGSYEYFLIL